MKLIVYKLLQATSVAEQMNSIWLRKMTQAERLQAKARKTADGRDEKEASRKLWVHATI